MHHSFNIGPENTSIMLIYRIVLLQLLDRCVKWPTTNVYKVESN